jgi:L-iditol 2-dehydrogenase
VKVLKYIEPRKMVIADIARPEIADGEVLVQTHACGICATDVKTFMRGHPLIQAGTVLGHETSGIIVESKNQDWRAGDRVVVAPYAPCGQCEFCQRGQFTLCAHLWDAAIAPGGFSEFIRVPQRVVQQAMFHLPDSIDFVTASLVEPLACCYHGFDALQLKRGDSLLIIGDGPMGLMQTMIARTLGATPIVLAGMTPDRLTWGARHADCVINAAEKNVRDVIGAGVNKVMVSVGDPRVAEQAMEFVGRGGAINFFAGLPRDSRVTLDPNRIHYEQISLVGTFGFAPHHFKRAMDALATLDLAGLITRTVALDELENAFADSAAFRGIKTVAVFDS